MKSLEFNKLIEACNGKLLTEINDIEINGFSKDTRTIKEGDIYLGIKGENIDGNDFIEEAFEKGAIGCIVDKDINIKIINKYKQKAIIKVDNTIAALQEIAKYKRSLYDIPVIAVTGSVRKNKYQRCNSKCIISKI